MRQAQWSVGENVDILTRPKAKVPGDWAIRYAAMVLVTLIIAYKYAKFLGFLIQIALCKDLTLFLVLQCI